MKSIIPVIVLAFPHIVLGKSDLLPDICEPRGQETIEYLKKIIGCMKEHLKDSGDEGKAKKCIPKFAGEPGKEADKTNCDRNNKIIEEAVLCGKDYLTSITENAKFMDCFNKISPPFVLSAARSEKIKKRIKSKT